MHKLKELGLWTADWASQPVHESGDSEHLAMKMRKDIGSSYGRKVVSIKLLQGNLHTLYTLQFQKSQFPL